jgi:hypothetical protein
VCVILFNLEQCSRIFKEDKGCDFRRGKGYHQEVSKQSRYEFCVLSCFFSRPRLDSIVLETNVLWLYFFTIDLI